MWVSFLSSWYRALHWKTILNSTCLDVTLAGARSIVHELYDDTSAQILESRFQIITYVVTDDDGQSQADNISRSAWRPLQVPVRDWPLALCDASSVDPADLMASDVIYPKYLAENRLVHFNKDQNWYWLPDQTTDEVLLFKAVDSDVSTSCRKPMLSYHIYYQAD